MAVKRAEMPFTVVEGHKPRPPEDDTRRRASPATGALNGIGWAVSELWTGAAVRRAGWNGKGMYLKLQVPDEDSRETLPYVWIRTVDGHRVPWLCSQTDLLAKDWESA